MAVKAIFPNKPSSHHHQRCTLECHCNVTVVTSPYHSSSLSPCEGNARKHTLTHPGVSFRIELAMPVTLRCTHPHVWLPRVRITQGHVTSGMWAVPEHLMCHT
eukprot:682404-Rhodomonas_salina.1